MKKLLPIVLLSMILFTCSEDDPCEGVVCLNGGSCENGTCSCATGFQGATCADRSTPSKILITQIDISTFRNTPAAGGTWDAGASPTSKPDIYMSLFNADEISLVFEQPTYWENATSGTAYSYTPDVKIEIDEIEDEYSLELYDYDFNTDDDDFMGGVLFTPSSLINGLPATITLAPVGGPTSFVLHVEYTF